MENQIKLVRGRIEEVTLAEPVVDILVSEWMGYFLLFEGMLESVIHARNKYLSPNGLVLPNECSISIMAVGDSGTFSTFKISRQHLSKHVSLQNGTLK